MSPVSRHNDSGRFHGASTVPGGREQRDSDRHPRPRGDHRRRRRAGAAARGAAARAARHARHPARPGGRHRRAHRPALAAASPRSSRGGAAVTGPPPPSPARAARADAGHRGVGLPPRLPAGRCRRLALRATARRHRAACPDRGRARRRGGRPRAVARAGVRRPRRDRRLPRAPPNVSKDCASTPSSAGSSCCLRAGRDREAEDAAATLALQQPYREGPVALQMRALARLGRHVEGLRAFADFRHRLVEELGVEPSPALPCRRTPTAQLTTARRRSACPATRSSVATTS